MKGAGLNEWKMFKTKEKKKYKDQERNLQRNKKEKYTG